MKNEFKSKVQFIQIALIMILFAIIIIGIFRFDKDYSKLEYELAVEKINSNSPCYNCECSCHKEHRSPYPIKHPNGDVEYEHRIVDKHGWIHRKYIDSTEFEF